MDDLSPLRSRMHPTWKPQFGDLLINVIAGESNPTRIGRFVRVQRIPRGRVNAGTWWELTDGEGKFWACDPRALERVPDPAPAPGRSEEEGNPAHTWAEALIVDALNSLPGELGIGEALAALGHSVGRRLPGDPGEEGSH